MKAVFAAVSCLILVSPAQAFEGRISATLTSGGDTQTFLYTVGTNRLRIEPGDTNWPHAKNIVDLDTSGITLLFPHNRSFMRLKTASASVPPFPTEQGMPVAGIGGTSFSGLPGAPQVPQTAPAGNSATPAVPIPPMMPIEPLELKATGDVTNLLGCNCKRYELKQHGAVMEIWATEKLISYQPYLQNQPPRFAPRVMEEQWGELLKSKKLFPLLAILRSENGTEHLRFEVKSIAPGRVEDGDGELFNSPSDYREIQPLPF